MRIQQSEHGDAWYVMNIDDQIDNVFYSKEAAAKYIKERKLRKKYEKQEEK